MLGSLTDEQIDQVLFSKIIGRIGCHAEGKTYIVPIAYVFDGSHIYAHSRVGKKIVMMRKNPDVCFQVDDIDNLANWRSVVIEGEFEELKTAALQSKALTLLKNRLSPLIISDAANPSQSPPPGEKRMRPVLFRIVVKSKSGRYEKK